MSAYEKLTSLAITLPGMAPPVAAFVPFVRSGNLIFISGHIAKKDGKPWTGRLGADITTAEGKEAARGIAIDLMGALEAATGNLDSIRRIVKLLVLVNSTPTFNEQHLVANGASELLAEVFGDRGKHARSAFGAAQIPFGSCVEIELIAEVAEAPSQPDGWQAALVKDAGTLSDKFAGLARVMSGKYDWKPAEGVRSVADVFNLIVKENGLLAGVLSGAPSGGSSEGFLPQSAKSDCGTFQQRPAGAGEAVWKRHDEAERADADYSRSTRASGAVDLVRAQQQRGPALVQVGRLTGGRLVRRPIGRSTAASVRAAPNQRQHTRSPRRITHLGLPRWGRPSVANRCREWPT
jgi:enamine deaminase RidA (YjgF/YER057c/UK114 family)